jgi:hypothetical protein
MTGHPEIAAQQIKGDLRIFNHLRLGGLQPLALSAGQHLIDEDMDEDQAEQDSHQQLQQRPAGPG